MEIAMTATKTHMKKDRENIVVGEEEEVTVQSISHYYAVAGRNQKFRNLLAYIEQYYVKIHLFKHVVYLVG